ncbi:MAG: hypothetical protein WC004_01640 [Candidatus Absconditabacterales bacterium]
MERLQTFSKLVAASALGFSLLGLTVRQFEKPSAYAIDVDCSPLFNMPCSSTNACGDSMPGMYSCQGVCSAPTPPMPPLYGLSCVATSPTNACGDFEVATGTYQCNDSCSAIAPETPRPQDSNENETPDCLEQESEDTPPTPPPSGGGGSPTYVPSPAPAPTSTPSQPIVAQNTQITPPFTDLLITGPTEEEEEPELPTVLPKTGADQSEYK